MAKRRDRYVISGNMTANGKSLKDVVLVDMGPCSSNGKTTNDDGKKLLKSDLTYKKFKFETPKVGRELGLPKTLTEFALLPQHVSTFLTKQNEETTT